MNADCPDQEYQLRDALELFRQNSELIRRIGEIDRHIGAIEARFETPPTTTQAALTKEYRSSTSLHGDVAKKRELNIRLKKELSAHRAYFARLRREVRGLR